jgi:hypothetical protein
MTREFQSPWSFARRLPRSLFWAWLVMGGTSAVLFGCSGNDNAIGDGGGDTTPSKDAGKDATKDTSSMTDTSIRDTATDTMGDTATDTGTDAGICTGIKKGECVSCCSKAYPTGAKAYLEAELACACVPELCGPVDGGPPDGGTRDGGVDGSAIGEGACEATCGSATAKPSRVCETCLREVTGTAKKPEHCYMSVSDACLEAGAECTDLVACVEGCLK